MDINDLISLETARMDIYQGLSACYYIPGNHLVAQLGKIEKQLTFIGSKALAPARLMQRDLQRKNNLDALKCEFARLFVGPFQLPAPPYGSIYLDGKREIMGKSTADVRRRYLESGLSLAKSFKDAPDHIAAELEFMYVEIFNEIEAIQSGEAETVIRLLRSQRSFLYDHIGAWIGDFATRVKKEAKMAFYRHLTDTTTKFIMEDLKTIMETEIPKPSQSPRLKKFG